MRSLTIACLAGCGLLLGCAGVSRPEEAAASTPTAPDAAKPAGEARESWEFPFELSAGKIFIDVRINGQGPYAFAMDTGSPPTVIDLTLARDLGLNVIGGGRVGGAGEGSSEMGMVSDVSISFGGITLPARTMMAADLNERLAPFSARPVLGLIGNDFITSHVVAVDYAKQRVRVWKTQGWEYTGTGTVIPTRVRGYTFVNGRIKLGSDAPGAGEELPVRYLIDTGAGLAVSLNTPFVNKNHLLTQAGPRFRASVGWGLGGEVKHDVCRLDWIEVGREADAVRIDRPVAALSQDKRGALASGGFEALIGGEILSRYTVIFDAARKRMILEPNERAKDPIEFDMSGIALGGNGGHGPLVAMRVREGTPAAEAGVKEGDEILAIDGHAMTGKDRDRARDLLKVDGADRSLRLKRGDETLEVRLKLRRMVRAETALGCPC